MTNRLLLALSLSVLSIGLGACAAPVDDLGESAEALRVDCSLVRCALPLCATGQRVVQPAGTCCPRCVGQPHADRCATVLCAAVQCAEGEQAVTRPGQCCSQCQPAPPAAECQTDYDCPQYVCVRCPCPYSECRGNQCVTQTPDESTCYSTDR